MKRPDARIALAWAALSACAAAILYAAVRLAPCCYLTLNMDH